MQRRNAAAVATWVLAALGSAAAAAAASSSAHRGAAAVTPVQKVLEMLSGMLEKGKKEKSAEQVQFAAYRQFCDDSTREKTTAVQTADEQIQMLKANIQMATTAAEDLAREIQKHDEDMGIWQADIKAATQIRETERNDYTVAHKDYSETIDAISRATDILKAKAKNTAQAPATTALAQLAARRLVPEADKTVLAAFLAEQQDLLDGGPEMQANAYEFRSGGIVEMLGKLRDKFLDERSQLEQEETSRRHAHELLAQDLQNSIKNAQDARSTKTEQRAKHLQSVAEMQASLADTTSTRQDDSKWLSDTTANCKQKAADFEERQKLRQGEIEALQQALEILSSDRVSGAAQQHLSLQQLPRSPRAAALVQLRGQGLSPTQQRVAEFLNERAETLGSKVLSALAMRAQEDPFAKVKKMLSDLIARLQEAAGEEAQHEAWCKGELTENESVRNARSTDVERLTSEIDSKTSAIAKYAQAISDLTAELANTDQETQRLTQIRSDEKAVNTQTVLDAQEAQKAVQQAVILLKQYYVMAAGSTSLLQGNTRKSAQQPEAPAIFSAPYQGMQAENGGVVGMLEVIESDFANLESSTAAAEATAQKEYDRLMSETAVLKAQTKKDIEHNQIMKQNDQQALVDLNNDLASSEKELQAANAYYDKLKPSCVDSGMSFEERAKRRQEEIESLQEALRILNGEDLAAA